jgi:hypothetical protein
MLLASDLCEPVSISSFYKLLLYWLEDYFCKPSMRLTLFFILASGLAWSAAAAGFARANNLLVNNALPGSVTYVLRPTSLSAHSI